MKLSEYIKCLQTVEAKNGDTELHFQVKDYYGRYGEDATSMIETGETIWHGVRSGNGHTTLTIHLNGKEGKNPKIIFRK